MTNNDYQKQKERPQKVKNIRILLMESKKA